MINAMIEAKWERERESVSKTVRGVKDDKLLQDKSAREFPFPWSLSLVLDALVCSLVIRFFSLTLPGIV